MLAPVRTPPGEQIDSAAATRDSVATTRHTATRKPPRRPRNLQLETLRDDGLEGHGPLARASIAAGG